MPELPEVETIRLGLIKYVVGHKILDVEKAHPKIFQGDEKNVIGVKIEGARRVGKGLIIDLSNGYSLAIHIKLTGQLVYRGKETEGITVSPQKVGSTPNPFTHVIFKLDDGAMLYYNDQRRFGWIKVLLKEEVANLSFFKEMGPEPLAALGVNLSKEKKYLDLDKFKQIISGKTTKIKPLLMDQTKIGGIGNIYANDALYLAGIDPRRAAKSLTEEETEKLYEAILTVMKKGFEEGGASELNFVNILGQEGNYQNHALIYGKTGQKCKKCGSKIEFFKIAGRGTYFCPECQK